MKNNLISRALMFITSVLTMAVLFAVPVFAESGNNGLKISDISVSGFPAGYSASDVTLMDVSKQLSDGKMAVFIKIGVGLNPKEETTVDDQGRGGYPPHQWKSMNIKFSYSYDDGTYAKSGTISGGSAVLNNVISEEGKSYTDKIYQAYSIYADKIKKDDNTPSASAADDEEDDDDSSSGMSAEERQREIERHFAPNPATMTPEQRTGWNLVSREAPAVSLSAGAGVTAASAYQGPICRLAFQLAAPGYSMGHTYNMSFGSTSGTVVMKVPTDLVKTGRRFVLSFVTRDGRFVSTPALTADARGYLNFNLAGLGLAANTNNAVAIMYLD